MRYTVKYSDIFFLVVLLFANCTKETNNAKNPPVADAGTSQTIQLPVNTATLSGSGTTENFKITGYLWSLVSGPNVPVIASETSATTVVSGIIAGDYVFQLMVIDSAGLSDVDTVSLLVKPNPQQTLTLQPSDNPNEGHVDSYNDIGDTGDTEMPIGAWTYGSYIVWRQFIKFDMSAIPANATIVSANLFLYAMPNPHGGDMINAHSGSANACYIERIPANWTFTFNWGNQPGSVTTNRAVIPQTTSSFQDQVIDVKAMVQDMQTNGNYGFKIRMQNEVDGNVQQYASSYHSNDSLHPKLVIIYQ